MSINVMWQVTAGGETVAVDAAMFDYTDVGAGQIVLRLLTDEGVTVFQAPLSAVSFFGRAADLKYARHDDGSYAVGEPTWVEVDGQVLTPEEATYRIGLKRRTAEGSLAQD